MQLDQDVQPEQCLQPAQDLRGRIWSTLFLVLLPSLLLLSCAGGEPIEGTGISGTTGSAETSAASSEEHDIDIPQAGVGSSPLVSTVVFKLGDKSSSFKILHSKQGGSVVDDNGKTVQTFVDDRSDKQNKVINVNGPSGKTSYVLRVVGVDVIRIEDKDRNLLYKLKFDSEARYLIKNNADDIIYQMKEEPYGLAVSDGSGVVFKVRLKGGKIVLKDLDGKVLLSSKSEVPAPAMACFGMDKLNKTQQYSLAYALMFLRL